MSKYPPTYDDWPTCLTDTKWLLREASADPARAFSAIAGTTDGHCKLCGALSVPRHDWRAHVREHERTLAKMRSQRERENASRLRNLARLRQEARR